MHDQRSPDLSQTESICGSFGDSVACFAQADAGIVRDEVLHATGMVSSVFVDYCVLFLALMIPEFVQIFLGGQDKKHVGRSSSRSSTRNFDKIIQNPSFWLHPGENNKKQCMSRCDFYTLISVDPACRIPGDLRPRHQEVKG